MSHFKFRMSQLHKDWKAAKDEAPKLARKLKDGNADLALKDLFKSKFKSGLGDKLDNLAKVAKNLKIAQEATIARPNNVKLHEKWKQLTKELLDALLAVIRVVTEYRNAIKVEQKELGGVYDFLRKSLEELQSSVEGLLDQGKQFEKGLTRALINANTLYESVEFKIRKSRSYTDSEWLEYLAKHVNPKVSQSLPSFDFEF